MNTPTDPFETPPREDELAHWAPWRQRLHEVIFEADTPGGKAFDIALLIAILLSVLAVMLESVASIGGAGAPYHDALIVAEWVFTILFTIEYVLRLMCVLRPSRYALSFFGLVDLLAVVPTYIAFLIPGAQSLMVIRVLRLLRIFRVLKLARYLREADALSRAVHASRAKIAVFLMTILAIVVIMGAAMHLIEGEEAGFTSIPQSMYWAVVTMTTVGYGDIAPMTPLGEFLAALMMLTGYCMIIVPTGIISAELTRGSPRPVTTQHCAHCGFEGHDVDAAYCKRCGGRL